MTASRPASVALAIIFFLLAVFCLYGLLASFEPGTSLWWKVGYGLAGVFFFATALRFAMRR
ncbi:MAG: hypothetical protein MK116_10485 [Phycisphaerales bacterium]|nr:hypothetical protein [Phycisphaerales bacterium]